MSKLRMLAIVTAIVVAGVVGYILLPRGSRATVPTLLFVREFAVCDQNSGQPCNAVRAVKEDFDLKEVPKECCFLVVMNGDSTGQHMVDEFHLRLNGKEVGVAAKASRQPWTPVLLDKRNSLEVQVQGSPDAYIHVLISSSSEGGSRHTPP